MQASYVATYVAASSFVLPVRRTTRATDHYTTATKATFAIEIIASSSIVIVSRQHAIASLRALSCDVGSKQEQPSYWATISVSVRHSSAGRICCRCHYYHRQSRYFCCCRTISGTRTANQALRILYWYLFLCRQLSSATAATPISVSIL